MLDPRATQIVTDVTGLLEKKPPDDLKQWQEFVEHGTQVDPTLEPTAKFDTIARFYMRKTALALITTHASDKVSPEWITKNKQTLDEQYRTMSFRAGNYGDLMEADALVVGAPSGLITSGFVLAGYGNSLPAKLFAALALFCLAYLAGIFMFDRHQQKLPVEQRVKPTSISILARNFLFPNSRLDFDSRLLGRLDDKVNELLGAVKKAHVKKLA